MKWKRDYESPDVEVRRSGEGGRLGMESGFIGVVLSFLTSRFGWVGALIAVGVALFFGTNLFGPGDATEDTKPPPAATRGETASSDTRVQFVSFVLDDVQ